MIKISSNKTKVTELNKNSVIIEVHKLLYKHVRFAVLLFGLELKSLTRFGQFL